MARRAQGAARQGERVHPAARGAGEGAPRAAVGESREGVRLRGAGGPRRPSADLFARRGPADRPALHVRTGLERGLPELLLLVGQFQRHRRAPGRARHLVRRWCRVRRSRGSRPTSKRMGWTFRWVSSLGNDFNFDFGVSFAAGRKGSSTISRPQAVRRGEPRHQRLPPRRTARSFTPTRPTRRGLDVLNGAYQLLDITSKGGTRRSCPARWRG